MKYAVNCGGDEFITSDNITYVSDRGFSAGTISDHGKGFPIKLTKSPEVYQTERYADSDFFYLIPLEEPGSYVLILQFSEVWFSREQEKMFSVKVGDITVASLLDVFSQVGRYAAYDEFVQFKYENNKILINNMEAKGALKNGKLKINFVKTDFDNPKINAMVLYKGKIEETGFAEQKKFLEGYKRMVQEEAMKASRDYRIDPVYEDDLDFEDLPMQPEFLTVEESQSLLSVLSSLPAMISSSLLLVLVIAACLPSRSTMQPQLKPKHR